MIAGDPRWFIGLSMDAPVWYVTVLTTKTRAPVQGDVAVSVSLAIMEDPAVKRLFSTEHFSMNGTLIDVGTSMKSLLCKGGTDEPLFGPGCNAKRNLHGEERSIDTHVPTTDPDAWLYRTSNGQSSRFCFAHGDCNAFGGMSVYGGSALA